jgi:aryl-alcohol dehydrogenase-like predicted oxidoreductase
LPRFSGDALEANLVVVDKIREIADDREATPAQVALAWLRYRADEVGVASVPIPGTRRAARVEENLGSLDVALSDEQLATLDAAGDAVSGDRFYDLSWISAGRE